MYRGKGCCCAAAAAASRCKRHENRSQRNALAVHYARAGPWETRDRRKQSAPRCGTRDDDDDDDVYAAALQKEKQPCV